MAQPPEESSGGWKRKASHPPPSFPIEPKEEPIDIHEYLNISQEISTSELMRDEKMIKEEEMDEEKGITDNSHSIFPKSLDLGAHNNSTSVSVKVEKLSKSVSRPIRYTQSMYDSDCDVESTMKKSKTDSTFKANKSSNFAMASFFSPARLVDSSHAPPREVKEEEIDEEAPILEKSPARNGISGKGDEGLGTVKKRITISKTNDTELECLECEFRTRIVKSWTIHLRYKHNTTPTLAGLALLCECGHESLSESHGYKCAHHNTTVIRKRGGPIRRLGDENIVDGERVTPQCILCEAYPRTAYLYAFHLNFHHKSTLAQNGIYLICSCGLEIRYYDAGLKQLHECGRRQFTLHKLANE